MASELRVNTLKDASGNNSVATSVVASGSAKAWLDYNQVANNIDGSYNVSSVSDDATGLFTYTLTSAMSDVHWSHVHTVNAFTAQIHTAKTTTTAGCRTRDANANNTDATTNNIAVHGDLA